MQEKESIIIYNVFSVRFENSVTRDNCWHHSASLMMPTSYHRDEIFNPHLTTIKDSYSVVYMYNHLLKQHVLICGFVSLCLDSDLACKGQPKHPPVVKGKLSFSM